MSDPAILTSGLERAFGSVRALSGVDLEVRQGEVYGLLGANGAGKSTLLRILCTLLCPTAGEARISGHDVVAEPNAVRVRIGVALQEAQLDNRQTGRELLQLQARLYGFRGKQVQQRVRDVLDVIDVGPALDRRVGTYSGGMKRRLDLAVAFIHRPGVLFLDEPTTGLDPAARMLVWDEVRRLNREFGTAILLTTQYLEEADELAQRIGFIDRGRVIAEGTPEELKRSLRDDTIVIELDRAVDDLDAVADVLRRTEGVARVVVEGNRLAVHTGDGARAMLAVATSLQDQRACIRALELHTPSLDDVFLRLTGRDAGRLAPDAEPDGARQEEAAEELDGFVRTR